MKTRKEKVADALYTAGMFIPGVRGYLMGNELKRMYANPANEEIEEHAENGTGFMCRLGTYLTIPADLFLFGYTVKEAISGNTDGLIAYYGLSTPSIVGAGILTRRDANNGEANPLPPKVEPSWKHQTAALHLGRPFHTIYKEIIKNGKTVRQGFMMVHPWDTPKDFIKEVTDDDYEKALTNHPVL